MILELLYFWKLLNETLMPFLCKESSLLWFQSIPVNLPCGMEIDFAKPWNPIFHKIISADPKSASRVWNKSLVWRTGLKFSSVLTQRVGHECLIWTEASLGAGEQVKSYGNALSCWVIPKGKIETKEMLLKFQVRKNFLNSSFQAFASYWSQVC